MKERKVKPVYFTVDSTIFYNTLNPVQDIAYRKLLGLEGDNLQPVDLFAGETSKGFIKQPTFFRKDNIEFLVYPREHVFINGAYDDYTVTTVNGNKIRDNEFLVLKIFQQKEKWPDLPRLFQYSLETILNLEQLQKNKILTAEKTSQLLFDSLCTTYNVSLKFRELTKNYIHGRYDLGILGLYQVYRDTLLACHLYWDKIKTLLPIVNSCTDKSLFTLNIENYTNQLYYCLFPNNGIWSMKDEGDFKICFDSVENNFDALAKDYLLSRIMYRAYIKGIAIPTIYQKKYRTYSINKDYRRIVNRAKKEQQRFRTNLKPLPNELLLPDGRNKIKLETVLNQNKGKYVFIDLWASWCIPCIKEMPYLEQLKEKYAERKIVFIRISTEAGSTAWRKRIYELCTNVNNDYLLLDAPKTAFYQQHNVKTIPGYLLFDKEGKIIDADIPGPTDPELIKLLDNLLKSD